jgi:hypothetical protein
MLCIPARTVNPRSAGIFDGSRNLIAKRNGWQLESCQPLSPLHEHFTGVRHGSRRRRGNLHREPLPLHEIHHVPQPRRGYPRPNHAPDRALHSHVHHPTRDPSPDDRTTDVRTNRSPRPNVPTIQDRGTMGRLRRRRRLQTSQDHSSRKARRRKEHIRNIRMRRPALHQPPLRPAPPRLPPGYHTRPPTPRCNRRRHSPQP